MSKLKVTWKLSVGCWILEIEIISALPSGVYVVEVKTAKGVAVSKFIKE